MYVPVAVVQRAAARSMHLAGLLLGKAKHAASTFGALLCQKLRGSLAVPRKVQLATLLVSSLHCIQMHESTTTLGNGYAKILA